MQERVAIAWWTGFHVLVFCMLALDLFVAARGEGTSTTRRALSWTLLWITSAMVFGGLVTLSFGHQAGLEYFSGYLVEESLSVDNLFVFLLLFRYFNVTGVQQRRVLFYGVLGAFVMRGLFIAAGVELLERFEWVMYLFAAVLLVTALRLLRPAAKASKGPPRWIAFVQRALPFEGATGSDRLWLHTNGRIVFTTLFLVLIAIEITDLLFALDSVPAVLAITRRPFLAYTSNVFAVLGLRSLFPALTGALARFHLLHYGLAVILIFVATKMLLSRVTEIPVSISLAVILGVLAVSMVMSLVLPKAGAQHAA